MFFFSRVCFSFLENYFKKLYVRYFNAQYKKSFSESIRELCSLSEMVFCLSASLSPSFLLHYSSALSWVTGAFSPSVERIVDEIKGSVLCNVVSFGHSLHEVNFSLVLPGFRALARSSFACKCHVPALILYILESRVVILQHYLSENTVFPLTILLQTRKNSEESDM